MATFVKLLEIAATKFEDKSNDKEIFVNPHQVASARSYKPEVTVVTFGGHDHYVRGALKDILAALTYGRISSEESRAA